MDSNLVPVVRLQRLFSLGYHCPLMALRTKGFVNSRQLNRHFSEHGGDFGALNSDEYERLADASLGNEIRSGTHECVRKGGDIIRFDSQTQSYGVLDRSQRIRTYYKPVPCASLPASVRSAMRQAGRCHRYANNYLYFQAECKRW